MRDTSPAAPSAFAVATVAVVALALHVSMRLVAFGSARVGPVTSAEWPLVAALVIGGLPLVWALWQRAIVGDFSSDLLAGLAIVTSVLLGEYLAGTLVVLMLSGGQALESYAVRKASAALEALARRMPTRAHRRHDGDTRDVPLESVEPGDVLVIFPHETCPVDGTVVEGHSSMDESYLTGEPYVLAKAVGSSVLSGAINGEGALVIHADARAVDSRYASIMRVMRDSEQRRPRLRRLGDQLGAIYTPLAVALAVAAWVGSGDALRFLAVLVVATPCPLLIAIPVSIIGSVSLAARRGIVIRDPAVLERVDTCTTAIFDKTGTLTYGKPQLSEVLAAHDWSRDAVLAAVASLEQYSRHPLSAAVLEAARAAHLPLVEAAEVSERPGQGLSGRLNGRRIEVTSRQAVLRRMPEVQPSLPDAAEGLECVVLIDARYAATFRFRDEPRPEGRTFVRHLNTRHHFERVLIVSGDRESEVRYLAGQVGITEVHAGQSPEQKLALVRRETALADTVFVGDGINDAPALTAATVGVAFGQASDVTSEAAGAVVLDRALGRVDELLHIGRRMRRIALQSAIGGMALSVVGMLVAAAGFLPPVWGAVAQEAIDVMAVLNALRAGIPPAVLRDY